MKRLCPICQHEMIKYKQDAYTDYMCNSSDNKHHYSERRVDGEVERIKIRVKMTDRRFYCQLFVKDGFSEIWEGIENPNRVKINSLIDLNMDNIQSIENKIKTYLVFS